MKCRPTRRVVHLFCGLGGFGLGFKQEGWEGVGAVDNDEAACRDYSRLVGETATCRDIGKMTVAELRRLVGRRRPDAVVLSPPCKGYSGCLPEERSQEQHYQDLNELAVAGIFLALTAWEDDPVPFHLLENVPRIRTRGRDQLARIVAMLQRHGYAVELTDHDCGELGGLAQHRQRFMLVARHMATVPCFLRVPPKQRVRGVGEVLGLLPVPVPGSTAGGPMHALPRLIWKNQVRLALIPPGGDWRDLPEAVRLPPRKGRNNGPFGVEMWGQPAHAVLGNSAPAETWGSVADPRVGCWRRDGGHGVKGWEQPMANIIANDCIDNFPGQIADPRINRPQHAGAYGVIGWAQPSHAVLAAGQHDNSSSSVADPRVPWIVGPPFDWDSRTPVQAVILAADGTWHRPLTVLEKAALQGLPVGNEEDGWLVLDGTTKEGWSERIGNMVPVPTARAIARALMEALDAADDGRWTLGSEGIWVRPERLAA